MSQPNQKNPAALAFEALLQQNTNLSEVKQKIKNLTSIREKHAYHSLVQSVENYLQIFGLTYHETDHFNYINQLLHTKTTSVLQKIVENQIQVKSTIPPPEPEPEPPSAELLAEVQHVLNNVDLPLSLFKRDDRYWSSDNPKTIQVKEYVKEAHLIQKKWKEEFKKKRQEILNQKNQKYHQSVEECAKQEQKIKQQAKIRMMKKIEFIKQQTDVRKKAIEESKQFMKKQGKPMFKKIEEQFMNKVEIPTLEEKKKRLSEIRQLRRSVDLLEIQQHKEKYQKIKQQHQDIKVFQEPVKVSYKGSFYKSLQKSKLNEGYSDVDPRSFYDKRMEYSKLVKEKHMPAINPDLANEMEERIREMNKRRARLKNRKVRSQKNSQEDDEDEEEEDKEPSVEEEPEPQQQQDEDPDDEDEQGRPKTVRDDQIDPDRKQRYLIGVKYLQHSKKMRKQVELVQSQQTNQLKPSQTVDQSTSEIPSQIPKQRIKSTHVEGSKYDDPPRKIEKRIIYKNYLHEFEKTHHTIDFIDTSHLKQQLTKDGKLKNDLRKSQLEQKIRFVEGKAKHEEQLLRFKKIKKEDVAGKKIELDNAVIDTIKARLALMN